MTPPPNPPLFHPGQAVICIDPSIPYDPNPSTKYHLDMTTVYHVRWLELQRGRWHLKLVEVAEFVFEEIHFAPADMLPDEAIAELLVESLDPVAA